MIRLIFLITITLASCKASRSLIEDDSGNPAPAVIDAEPIYTANYSITGIPESFYQASEIILELTHENLKAIEYSFGTECVDPKIHEVNEPLTLLLENFHTKISLCLKGIDNNDLTEPGEGTVKSWVQGYPDLIGRTVKSTCEVISPTESFLVSIKLSQETPGETITPTVSNEIYGTGDCTGPIAIALTLLSENLRIAADSLSMTVEGEPWRLQMTTNEAGGIQFFSQTDGPFGTDGRTFVFTDPL